MSYLQAMSCNFQVDKKKDEILSEVCSYLCVFIIIQNSGLGVFGGGVVLFCFLLELYEIDKFSLGHFFFLLRCYSVWHPTLLHIHFGGKKPIRFLKFGIF